jgi:hypothetical protein
VNNIIKLVCLTSLLGLTACGGGDGVINGSDFTMAPVTFSSLATTGTTLANQVDRLDITPIRNMPTSGTARFDGVGAYSASESTFEGVIENPDTLSKVSFDANFAKSTIQGRAYDFKSADGGAVTGSLNISNGVIDDNTFTADIGGRLNNRGVPVTYNGDVAGAFAGSKANALAGVGVATGKASGYENQTVTSVFVAKQ